MSDRILSFTSSLIEKAQDFRYFGLICSFALILDSVLSYNLDSSLHQFSLSNLKGSIGTGNLVLFLVIFSLYLSFIVPLVKYSIFWSIRLIPYKVSHFIWPNEGYDLEAQEHYLRSSELKAYAIKKDNRVAYNVYLEVHKSNKEQDSLCYFSLSLLVSFGINIVFSHNVESSISTSLFSLFYSEVDLLSIAASIILPLLFVFCFYLGIIIYCGFEAAERDRIYMYRHGLDLNS